MSIISAILPTCVFMPVSTTTAVQCPEVMKDDEKSILCLSARGVFSDKMPSCFSDGTASPVKDDSSAFRDELSIILQSAHTISPVSSKTISPTTISSDGIFFTMPFLITFECGDDSFFKASMAFSARHSCTVPTTAFSITINSIMIGSIKSPSSDMNAVKKEIPEAIRSISTMKSLNCDKNFIITLFFLLCVRAFLPYFLRYVSACAEVRPLFISVPNRSAVC